MFKQASFGRKVFIIFNYLFLICTAITCLLPMINLLAISLSSSAAVGSGMVKLIPVDFTLESYRFVTEKPEFLQAMIVSVKKVIIGVATNMLLTVFIAYPLSKDSNNFKSRKFYVWFFAITMIFSGGLIPWYMTIKMTGLIDKFLALILPGAVPVFNVMILMNFFRGIPKEIEEAAFIDGASHWKTLWSIYIPLSTPALATLTLFCIVNHWNSWFEGLILMNSPKNYPLQSYLQTVIVNRDVKLMMTKDVRTIRLVSDRTSKAAQVFIAALPVLMVYPFLQKYFTAGIVLGSVKG